MEAYGFSYAVISAVFFGSAGFFIKNGYSQNLSPAELLTLQYIIAVIILFFICIMKYPKNLKPANKTLARLFVLGAFGNTLMTVSLYNAMAYLDIAVATMLLYTYPAMVSLFSFLFYKEKISKTKFIAIIGTFTGCLLVINIWTGSSSPVSAVGVVFGILSAVSYCFMNIYSSNIVDGLPPLVITFYSTLFSLIVLMFFNLKFIPQILHMPLASIANASLLAFFCEIIPLTLLYASIRYIGPIKASIISTLEIPVSAATAFIMVGEKLMPTQYAGIALVLLSIMILRKES